MIKPIKKQPVFSIITYSLLLALNSVASADSFDKPNTISLGHIAYVGSACPNGSVSAYFSQNATQLHINFKQYIVEPHGRNQHSLRKTCTIALPIKVPQGMSVSLVSAHYIGKVSLAVGSQAKITNSFSFSGRRGNNFKTTLQGPTNNGYSFHDPLSSLASVWSKCGKDATLRITTSTRVKNNTINSKSIADSGKGFTTQLRYRSCQ